MDGKTKKQTSIPPHVLKKKIEELKKIIDIGDDETNSNTSIDTDIDSLEDSESDIESSEEDQMKNSK
jgi:hypothetical protein